MPFHAPNAYAWRINGIGRTVQFNLSQGLATAAANKSAARMPLLDSAIDAGFDFVGGIKEYKLQKKLADKIRNTYDIWNGAIGYQSLLALGDGMA
ncbi:MAG: hypothetical protein LBD33_01765 [Puniceicoccales bacterium]|nr:hypothetical protein [Puniceicoccales bacterium]